MKEERERRIAATALFASYVEMAFPDGIGAMPGVSALLTMSIAGGALASPLVRVLAPCGARSTESLVFALTVALLGLFASIRRRI